MFAFVLEQHALSACNCECGRVAEWFKAPVLKTGRGFTLPRGFESHPFRQIVRLPALAVSPVAKLPKSVDGDAQTSMLRFCSYTL